MRFSRFFCELVALLNLSYAGGHDAVFRCVRRWMSEARHLGGVSLSAAEFRVPGNLLVRLKPGGVPDERSHRRCGAARVCTA